MKKRALLASVGVALLLGLLVAITGATASPFEGGDPPPKLAPVVLDGVPLSREEFRRLEAELASKGIYVGSVALPDPATGVRTQYAFTSQERMNEFLVSRGLPAMTVDQRARDRVKVGESFVLPPGQRPARAPSGQAGPVTVSPQSGCLSPDYWVSAMWEHIYCDGASIWAEPNAACEDLRYCFEEDWNDRISSAQAANAARFLILYEHINRGGENLGILSGGTYDDLRDYDWNDRASSFWVMPW